MGFWVEQRWLSILDQIDRVTDKEEVLCARFDDGQECLCLTILKGSVEEMAQWPHEGACCQPASLVEVIFWGKQTGHRPVKLSNIPSWRSLEGEKGLGTNLWATAAIEGPVGEHSIAAQVLTTDWGVRDPWRSSGLGPRGSEGEANWSTRVGGLGVFGWVKDWDEFEKFSRFQASGYSLLAEGSLIKKVVKFFSSRMLF